VVCIRGCGRLLSQSLQLALAGKSNLASDSGEVHWLWTFMVKAITVINRWIFYAHLYEADSTGADRLDKTGVRGGFCQNAATAVFRGGQRGPCGLGVLANEASSATRAIMVEVRLICFSM